MKQFKLSEFSKEHKAMVDAMKDQLIIVLVNRLGGVIEIPVAEIDNTARFALAMQLNPVERVFRFEVGEKEKDEEK